MGAAKQIHIAPIGHSDANRVVRRHHYSGSVVRNSQLHLGVFLDNRLEGAVQFGPSLDKRKVQGLVTGTAWNGFIELNRMAFSDRLPRNSESRALGVALRLLRRRYTHLEWVISFADAVQCGDGGIYRAAGFVLTGINKNTTIMKLPDGTVGAKPTFTHGCRIFETGGRAGPPEGAQTLPGHQLRYLYFLAPAARKRLAVPIVPFEEIGARGAGMYRGKQVSRVKGMTTESHSAAGGSTPTHPLQHTGKNERTSWCERGG